MATRSAKRRFFGVLLVLLTTFSTYQYALANHRTYGSGTCWSSAQAWTAHGTYYYIDVTIPTEWHSYIEASAGTWNAVPTSVWGLSRTPLHTSTGNLIKLAAQSSGIANTYREVTADGRTLTRNYTIFNANLTHSALPGGDARFFDVQNTMTHEFGHWIRLLDMGTGCEEATMYGQAVKGEIKKRSLDTPDVNGVSWQYPQ
jgi:hypothetical protein